MLFIETDDFPRPVISVTIRRPTPNSLHNCTSKEALEMRRNVRAATLLHVVRRLHRGRFRRCHRPCRLSTLLRRAARSACPVLVLTGDEREESAKEQAARPACEAPIRPTHESDDVAVRVARPPLDAPIAVTLRDFEASHQPPSLHCPLLVYSNRPACPNPRRQQHGGPGEGTMGAVGNAPCASSSSVQGCWDQQRKTGSRQS
jgi:hypothetical protein